MSKKNLDRNNRWRSKLISFRVSPEEGEVLSREVALSGLTKQDYIIKSISNHEMRIQGNSYVIRSLQNELKYFIEKFESISTLSELSQDDLDVLTIILSEVINFRNDNKETQVKVSMETFGDDTHE